eukprot:gene40794-53992_t
MALHLLFGCKLIDERTVDVLVGSCFKEDLQELHLIHQINQVFEWYGVSAEQLLALPFPANGQTLTLGDVAEIRRGYQDPRQFAMRFGGKPVIGL